MKKRVIYYLIILMLVAGCNKQESVVRMAVTTDVHGMIFPYDFVKREAANHSLSHIYTYASHQRKLEDTLFFLLDNGDFLQGQPTVYYYNFVDTILPHLSARVMNYLHYDAGTVGNHDIEAGPGVYNKIKKEFEFPWLAANAVNSSTGNPFFEPYTILKAGRKRIAVLGLITPGIPNWLPKNLWPNMEFRDMVESANEWIPRIKKEEDPDLMVGLFHSGTDASYGESTASFLNENAVLLVAEKVPGFDIIFAGHDHRVSIQHVVNSLGDSVLIVNPGSHARYSGQVTISFKADGSMQLNAENVPMEEFEPSEEFNNQFSEDYNKVISYLDDTITWLTEDLSGSDALFGPSSIISLIHEVQLGLSGADLSFTAPLSLSSALEEGPVLVSDMFKLYRFENMLYTMELSGMEIDGFLEHAAGLWFNTMTGPGDHLLRFDPDRPGRLAQPSYNFSSAAGIDYSVDLRQPEGQKVTIHGFSDGETFDENSSYRVAINSYRGNGGGGHLTYGAGIPKEELAGRITWSTEIDLRYYLMKHLALSDTLHPKVIDNWSFTPEAWASKAAERDRSYFR